jgi:hypothetical protein
LTEGIVKGHLRFRYDGAVISLYGRAWKLRFTRLNTVRVSWPRRLAGIQLINTASLSPVLLTGLAVDRQLTHYRNRTTSRCNIYSNFFIFTFFASILEY